MDGKRLHYPKTLHLISDSPATTAAAGTSGRRPVPRRPLRSRLPGPQPGAPGVGPQPPGAHRKPRRHVLSTAVPAADLLQPREQRLQLSVHLSRAAVRGAAVAKVAGFDRVHPAAVFVQLQPELAVFAFGVV